MQVPISFMVVFKKTLASDKSRIVIRALPDVVDAKTIEMLEGGDGKDVSTVRDAKVGLNGEPSEVGCEVWQQRGRGCENIRVVVGIYLKHFT